MHRIFFFFQAEDGIRDYKVTGVQTCALPISRAIRARSAARAEVSWASSSAARARRVSYRERVRSLRVVTRAPRAVGAPARPKEIGRAACRERGAKRGKTVEVRREKGDRTVHR